MNEKFIIVDLACGYVPGPLGIIRFTVNDAAWEEVMGQGVPMREIYIRDMFSMFGFDMDNINHFSNPGVISISDQRNMFSIEFTYEVLNSAVTFEYLVNDFCKELSKRGFSYTITQVTHSKINLLTGAEIQLQ